MASRVVAVKSPSSSSLRPSSAGIRVVVEVRSTSPSASSKEEKEATLDGKGGEEGQKAARGGGGLASPHSPMSPSISPTAPFGHSFAASRYRRSQSIGEALTSPKAAPSADAKADPVNPAPERPQRQQPSSLLSPSPRPVSPSPVHSRQRSSTIERSLSSSSSQMARTSPLTVSVKPSTDRSTDDFLSPSSASLLSPRPLSAPTKHRRAASSQLSSTTPLTPPAGKSSGKSSQSHTPRSPHTPGSASPYSRPQRKPKPGPILSSSSSSSRLFLDLNDTPAPGAYRSYSAFNKDPSKGVRMHERLEHKVEVVPGPGSYSPQTPSVAVSAASGAGAGWAAASQRDTSALIISPSASAELGPGAYTVPSTMGAGPATSIRSRLSVVDPHANVPAPGAYEVPNSTLSAQGGARMDTTERTPLFPTTSAAPAPGAYDLPSSIGSGPSASIRSRLSVYDPHASVPAPGSYEVNPSSLSSVGGGGMALSTERAPLFDGKEAAPAPGAYDLPQVIGTGPAAAIRSRIEAVDVHAGGAAPGSYDTNTSTLSNTHSHSMMQGTERGPLFTINTDTPAPNQYDSNHLTMGTGGPSVLLRSRLEAKDVHAGGAAPGSYDSTRTDMSMGGKGGAMAMDAQSGRGELWAKEVGKDAADAPAPGSYDLPSSIGVGPSASIRSRIEVKDERESFPAVGAYEPQLEAIARPGGGGVGMEAQTGRKELWEGKADAPAPGEYDLPSSLGKGPAASIRSRVVPEDPRSQYPGVGSYDTATSSLSSTSGPSMASSSGHTANDFLLPNPSAALPDAPHAYDLPDVMGTGPAAAIRSRIEQKDIHAGGAAVGSYDLPTSTLSSTGGAQMDGTTARGPLFEVDASALAPGQYDVASTIGTGPAASIRSRIQVKDPREAVPGVGQYETEPATSQWTTSNSSLSMAGQSGRGELFVVSEGAVGPGQYEVSGGVGSGGPSHSMASRVLDGLQVGATVTPSPGAYSLPSTASSTQSGLASFGAQSGRAELFTANADTAAVAPGQYNLPSSIGTGPSATMRSRLEVVDERVNYPSVGQYYSASQSSSLSTQGGVAMDGSSAREELWQVDTSSTAAPGSYNLPSSIGAGPAARIRSRLEVVDERMSYPSVGQYEASPSMAEQGGQSTVSMAAGTARGELWQVGDAENTPAPGSYSLPSSIGSGPSASIRSRLSVYDPHASVPAPGSYEVNPSSLSSVGGGGMALSTERAPLFDGKEAAPAPGAYDLPQVIGTGPAAAIRSRIEAVDVHAGGAAPGSYDTNTSTLSNTHSHSMMQGTERGPLFTINTDTPAPNQYDSNHLTMGTGGSSATIRSRLEVKDERMSYPAVGSYDVSPTMGQSGGAAVAMSSTSGRAADLFPVNHSMQALAPGSYDLPQAMGSGPAASIRSRLTVKDERESYPSVGQYDAAHASTLSDKGGVSMASASARPELFADGAAATDTPAPGSYTLPGQMGTGGPAASIRSRLSVADPHAFVPAPGAYETSASTLSGGGAVSLARGVSRDAELFPVNPVTASISPSSYDLPSSIGQGPSASIRSRLEVVSATASNPAPGQYSNMEHQAIGTGGPSVRMRGYSERAADLFDHTQTLSQGPASYDTTRPLGSSAPAHSMGVKREVKDERINYPAVGAYDLSQASQSRPSALSMDGQSGRGELFVVSEGAVGPGQYEVSGGVGSGGPSHSMASRVLDGLQVGATVTPSPGAYSLPSTASSTQSGLASFGAQSGRAELFTANADTAAVAPGQYNLPSSIGTGPSATMRSRLEVVDERVNYPSVGQYYSASQSSSLSTQGGVAMDGSSAREELWQVDTSSTAAPGSYNLPSSIGAGPAARIRSRLEVVDERMSYPSVGQYEASPSMAEQGGQSTVSMAAGTARGELWQVGDAENTPAPGSYSLPSSIGSGPSASIRSRLSVYDPHASVPAPGSYEVNPSSLSSVGGGGMALSTERAPLFDGKEAAPAPGAYDLPQVIGTGPAAAIRSRIEAVDVHAGGAAPGSYDTNTSTLSNTHSHSMMQGTERGPLFTINTDTPAPNQYDSNHLTMGTGGSSATIRSRLEVKDERMSYPAVGSYDVSPTMGQSGGAAVAMSSTSGRAADLFPVNHSMQALAPGSYDLPQAMGSGPAASIRSRLTVKDERESYPSVGQYDAAHASTLSDKGGVSMASASARPELFADGAAATDTPAPGSYTLPGQMGTGGPAASIRSRLSVADPHAFVPAPGAYETSASTLSGGGAVSLARGVSRDAELFPVNPVTASISPSSYDLPSSIGQGPSASIRSRLEVVSATASNPAPGQYSNMEHQAIGTGGPSVRMRGYSERAADLFDHTQTLSQGPASYDTTRPLGSSAPAHSMGVKREVKDERINYPAVGAYDLSQASQSRPSALSMDGQSGRGELFVVSEGAVGPGQYEVSGGVGSGGPSHSMASRVLDGLQVGATVTPSPGAYSLPSTASSTQSGLASFGAQSGRAELFTANADTAAVAPGQYNLPSSIGTGPSATMRSRLEVVDERVNYPSVGQYYSASQSSSLSTQGGVAMDGSSAREELWQVDTSSTAAPGSYNLPSSIGAGPAARIRSRLEVVDERMSYPSVGQYEASPSMAEQGGQSTVSMAAGTARGELWQVGDAENTPAPGSYSLPSSIGSGPSASIRSRLSVYDPHASVPAPGSYEVNPSSLSSVGGGGMALSTERAPLFDGKEAAPAPGAYDLPQVIGTGPAAAIRSRIEAVDVHAGGAAPGSYDTNTSTLSNTHSHSMMQGTERGPLFTINTDTPAPNQYDTRHLMMGTEGPKVSIHGRTVDPLSIGATLTPGPASYHVQYPAEADDRDFTFGGIHRPSANLREFMDNGSQHIGDSYNTSGPGLLD